MKTPEQKLIDAQKIKEQRGFKRKAVEHFQKCSFCDMSMNYKTVGFIGSNCCNKCAKLDTLEHEKVLKLCQGKDCEKFHKLSYFGKVKGQTNTCLECLGLVSSHDGPVRRCISEDDCIHPEAEVFGKKGILPESEEYFNRNGGHLRTECKSCKIDKGKKHVENNKDKFIGKPCTKCGSIIVQNNENRQQCYSCYRKRRQVKSVRYSPEEVKEKDSKDTSSSKICPSCSINKPLDEYKLYTTRKGLPRDNKCRSCRNKSFKATDDDIHQFHEETKNLTSVCVECKEDLPYSNFRVDYCMTVLNIRKKCKRCSYKSANRTDRDYEKLYYSNPTGIYDIYCMSAKAKGLEIHKELLINIIESNCFYCGRQVSHGDMKHKIHGDYNGIDRIDSSKGYVKGNMLPCCNMCNYMKNTLDTCSFIHKICQITKVSQDDPRMQFVKHLDLCGRSNNFQQYESKAKNKGFVFEINKRIFKEIVTRTCQYCGETNTINSIGIDRIDSSKGYTIENVVPCCSYCNYIKREYNQELFVQQCYDIESHTKGQEKLLELLKNTIKYSRALGRSAILK